MTTPIPVRRSRYPGEFMLSFLRRPVELLRDAAAKWGDVVLLRGDTEPVILINHPDLIRDVLVTYGANFKKGRALENARRLLGDGLLTSEGELHRRQRRLIQPAFHRRQIERYANAVSAASSSAWSDRRAGEAVEMLTEMMAVTMPVVVQTLFGAALPGRAREISGSLGLLVGGFRKTLLPGSSLLERLPLPHVRRMRAAESRLHAVTAEIVAERRAAFAPQQPDREPTDLLGMLIAAQDEEAAPGAGMSDAQIHDEVLTLFIAGHETTSVWLTWTWYLLSRCSAAEAALHAEVDAVLSGREPTYSDIDRLPWTRCVLLESLRLYPPAWAVGRRCIEATTIGAWTIEPGAILVMSPATMHVDPRYWPRPLDFEPERWRDGSSAETRPKYAFFPFGAGTRTCIGEQFAWMEATLILAALAQKWQPRCAKGFRPQMRPGVTLRPNAMPMILERRSESPATVARAA